MSKHDPTIRRESGEAPVPKVCGADVELGNFLFGVESPQGTGHLASKLLLREIPGVPRSPWSTSGWNYAGSHAAYGTGGVMSDGVAYAGSGQTLSIGYNSQDWGRKFLPSNGGCVYIDLDHLELCIPEVYSAYDHVAAWHAMLRIARQAQQAANAALDHGLRIEVLVNNSDGLGSSYGGHLNFLLSRRCWDNIFRRKIHHLLYLASYQAASIVITGQGKVGAEQEAPPVDFQLSQRSDFFETLTGPQTTYRRPLVNSRNEALCADLGRGGGQSAVGSGQSAAESGLARLHVIFYDSNLCQVACLLKVGVMQILLAMLEAERVRPAMILDDPLEAVVRFSHDPTLQVRARTLGGKWLTAVQWQLRFLEEAQRFYDRGGCEGVVPRAGEILALYADTLDKLRTGDLDALSGRLDWVLKLRALKQVMVARPDLSWDSLEIKHLDHVYSALDADDGLYWNYERAGVVERVVEEGRIEWFVHHPPEETRAWTRAMLLRLAGPEAVQQVDWDRMTFRETGPSGWPVYRTLNLPHPLGLNRAATGRLFGPGQTLTDVLDGLIEAEGTGCVSRLTWPPANGHASQESPALLPAPDHATASGSDSACIYDCGSFGHEDLEQEGEKDDGDS